MDFRDPVTEVIPGERLFSFCAEFRPVEYLFIGFPAVPLALFLPRFTLGFVLLERRFCFIDVRPDPKAKVRSR